MKMARLDQIRLMVHIEEALTGERQVLILYDYRP